MEKLYPNKLLLYDFWKYFKSYIIIFYFNIHFSNLYDIIISNPENQIKGNAMVDMGTLLLVVGGALFFALFVFFVCEEKSLKNADFSDMKGLFTAERKVSECAQEFDTVRYLVIYFVVLLAFHLAVINMVFVPNGFGLVEKLAYTFFPSLLGSWLILLVKWTYQPIIKLVSSFMYGSVYMGAAITAFVIAKFIA